MTVTIKPLNLRFGTLIGSFGHYYRQHSERSSRDIKKYVLRKTTLKPSQVPIFLQLSTNLIGHEQAAVLCKSKMKLFQDEAFPSQL